MRKPKAKFYLAEGRVFKLDFEMFKLLFIYSALYEM